MMCVVICLSDGVCNSFFAVFSSVEIDIFTKEVVFCLTITCKTIYLIFKDFLKLSLGANKDFWGGKIAKRDSRVEVNAYCFEALGRAMIIKFKLTVALNLMFKRTKTTKQIIGSHLRCAYNHVLLEKTSRLYQTSVNSSCALTPPPPPPGWPPRISIFLPWMANFQGWGLLSCQIPRGGDE